MGRESRIVVRCPRCGATDAGEDPARSVFEITYMQCNVCGHGEGVDAYQLQDEWNVELALADGAPLPARVEVRSTHCGRCLGDDPEEAWQALRTDTVRAIVEESHFGLTITACRCGQRALKILAERVDWAGGDDDQTWLLVPIAEGEVATLERAGPGEIHAVLDGFAPRRHIVRTWAEDGKVRARWRSARVTIPPHD